MIYTVARRRGRIYRAPAAGDAAMYQISLQQTGKLIWHGGCSDPCARNPMRFGPATFSTKL